MLTSLLTGFILSCFMGFAGYYKSALSKSGVVGAIIVGTAIFGIGGWRWGLILLTFFVSSSLLSRFKEDRKAVISEKFDKGNQRDIWQAFANGGIGALIALANLIWPANPWLWIAFLGAMGTVNADTWATEIGTLSRATPRSITTGKQVSPGTSGGITPLGTLAALFGALLIGFVAWLSRPSQLGIGVSLLFLAGLGGLAGAFFDSLLGATYQTIYQCPRCQRETERKTCCEAPTRRIRGFPWLNNDWVNLLSSIIGAIVAVLLGFVIT
ncbi:MAG: DUF92 domain-containing protein [Chloroflexota bacterium]